MNFNPKVATTLSAPTKSIQWREVISPNTNYLALNLREVWQTKYLMYLLIRKFIIVRYRSTVIGPAWAVFQPLSSTLIFYVVFDKVAGLSTGEVPSFIFYMSGNIMWLYFVTLFGRGAHFFMGNAGLLSKVYIPKFTMLFAIAISEVLTFLIQFLAFIGFTLYYIYQGDVHFTAYVLLFPILFVLNLFFAIALGNIASFITLKYRDLMTLIGYVVQFVMYLTPVVYPLSIVEDPKQRLFLMLNPLTGILETMRLGFFGVGHFSWLWFAYDVAIVLVLFLIGLIAMRRSEKTFADII